MAQEINIDHLFRHQYGKLVAICTRIFGFQHLPTIEDAIQDTFIKALKSWQSPSPGKPGGMARAIGKTPNHRFAEKNFC